MTKNKNDPICCATQGVAVTGVIVLTFANGTTALSCISIGECYRNDCTCQCHLRQCNRGLFLFFATALKVAKASTIVTVACRCHHQHFCLKNIANVNELLWFPQKSNFALAHLRIIYTSDFRGRFCIRQVHFS
jgi:hypothetical protein